MGTLLLFAGVFFLFGGFMYLTIQYTQDSVGVNSPLQSTVIYQYGQWDFMKWANTPVLILCSFGLMWIWWLLLTNLGTATKLWPYLLTGTILVLSAGFFYLIYKMIRLEEQFWTIIKDTALALDPVIKSITVHRAGTSTVLTSSTVALVESHIIGTGSKSPYYYYRFIEHDGNATSFFDYGKGLRFAIDEYFKGVPTKWVVHKFPFSMVLAA